MNQRRVELITFLNDSDFADLDRISIDQDVTINALIERAVELYIARMTPAKDETED